MTSDALQVVKCLFQTLWQLLTSWHIPGTRVTPAAWYMFVAFFVLLLRFLSRLSGIALGSVDTGKGEKSIADKNADALRRHGY